jgi:hypothetical protein
VPVRPVPEVINTFVLLHALIIGVSTALCRAALEACA